MREPTTRAGADRIATNLAVKIQGLIYFDTPSVEQVITGAGGKLYYTNSALAAWTSCVLSTRFVAGMLKASQLTTLSAV